MKKALILAALLNAAPALAVEPDEILADPALEHRARALSTELRCVVCQNQSIDDSEAPLARDLRLLLRERLLAADTSWVSGAAPDPLRHYGAKTRYRQADAGCALDGDGGAGTQVRFDEPQWAVTPGQSVVVYDGEVCLGGGIIQ